MSRAKVFGVGLPLLAFAMAAHASTITYSTSITAKNGSGDPVSATAIFTTGLGTLDITLTDTLANPTSVGQLISDLGFVLSNGASVGTLASSSGTQLTVNSNGTVSLGSTGSTGWGMSANFLLGSQYGLQLSALGFSGPAGLIIGPPGPGGTYSNANSSIAGNGPHNPFLNQSATFHITGLSGVTSATTVTNVAFSFGTTPGDDVPGGGGGGSGTVPEPVSMVLTGSGLVGLYFIRRRSASR
jgi:hypothetical protein